MYGFDRPEVAIFEPLTCAHALKGSVLAVSSGSKWLLSFLETVILSWGKSCSTSCLHLRLQLLTKRIQPLLFLLGEHVDVQSGHILTLVWDDRGCIAWSVTREVPGLERNGSITMTVRPLREFFLQVPSVVLSLRKQEIHVDCFALRQEANLFAEGTNVGIQAEEEHVLDFSQIAFVTGRSVRAAAEHDDTIGCRSSLEIC